MKKKILVVDDQPNNLALLRQILKDDYDLAFAKSGEAALESMRKQRPDLVLLDVMMPGMDGYSVRQEMNADPRISDIPVIFCTAMTQTEDEVRGLEIGAVDYITKPVKPAVVKLRVQNQLALADINYELSRQVHEATSELFESRLQTLQMLGRAAEFKDNETGLHVIRMSHYSVVLANALGWNEDATDYLLNAAPMHDIGKIGIADTILTKPGPLDPEQRAAMDQHTIMGAKIIGEAPTSPLLEMAKTIALYHHEKWNGKGYPEGLTGEDIPIAARIVAIADVFDALTTKRPYKEAWPVEKATDLIQREAGEHFDPTLAGLFLDRMDEVLAIRERWAER